MLGTLISTEIVDRAIDRAVAERRVVGAVVLVAHDGRLVYRRAAGLADRELQRPMTADATFRFASITKLFVSVATLVLAERGVVSLDAPVTRWLPDFRPRTASGHVPTITLRHLLTHTSGLTYGFFPSADDAYRRAGVSDGLDDPGITLDENLRRLASVPLSFAPGAAWGYSLATDVLGAAIARAAGAPLPEVVRALVADPLGIRDSGFGPRPLDALVTPYADGAPEPVRMGAEHVVSFGGGEVRFAPGRAASRTAYPSGGAGMVGTARDVLALIEALRVGGGAVLRPDSVRAFATHAVGDGRPLPGWGFGLGARVLLDPDEAATPQTPGTFEWGGAYGHRWFVDPARRLSVVSLTNTAMEGMAGAFPGEVRDAVYAALDEA